MDYQIPYDGCIGEFTWCEKLKREIPENWELVRLEDVTKHLTDGEHGSVSEDPKGQYWLYGASNIRDAQYILMNDIQMNLEQIWTVPDSFTGKQIKPKHSIRITLIYIWSM